ncbi:MAG TPA: hypothetical protein VFX19_07355 [Dehalococcoidia bacterium]|nr:hypothetical protein [Dehalococcoidia bacterium]
MFDFLLIGVIDALFVSLAELAGGLFTRRMKRFFAADALIMATVASVVIIGLVLVRDIDFLGVVALVIVALIAGWLVHRDLLRRLEPPDQP